MRALFFLLILNAFSAPASAGERTLVFLGDSLTAGFGLNEEQAYPALVAEALKAKAPGWKVVNAGVSGDTTAGGLRRLDWVLRSKPSLVFVCLGANDGLRGIQLPSSQKNLEAIVAKVRRSGAGVALAGMELPTNYGHRYRSEFHQMYPKLAKRLGVELLPFLLEGVAGEAALNQADGIHPNAQGQKRVAATVEAFLLPRLDKLAGRGAAEAGEKKVITKRSQLEGK